MFRIVIALSRFSFDPLSLSLFLSLSLSLSLADFDMAIVYKRPDDGSYLDPKHVAGNKLIKKIVLCLIDLICTLMMWYHQLGYLVLNFRRIY